MDKEIKKEKKAIDKGMDKLIRMDKKHDKKLEKHEKHEKHTMSKKKSK